MTGRHAPLGGTKGRGGHAPLGGTKAGGGGGGWGDMLLLGVPKRGGRGRHAPLGGTKGGETCSSWGYQRGGGPGTESLIKLLVSYAGLSIS